MYARRCLTRARPRPSARARRRSTHQEASAEALAVAETELSKAGVAFTSSWEVGDVAEQIGKFVKAKGVNLVVMGSRGHSGLMSIALGSVAMKCIAGLEVPVMVVPSPKSNKG